MSQKVTIRPFVPEDAQAFHALNLAWISAFFQPEAKDEQTLSDPEGTVLTPGGEIFVAEAEGAVVGCVARLPMANQGYEVAKRL
jgi:hypothetical protein